MCFAGDVTIMEEIVCKVNGDIITRTEMAKARRDVESELRGNGLSGARLEEAFDAQSKDILREKIDELLLVQKAKELNLKVDAEVTKRLAGIQSAARIVDEDRFHEYIREHMGGMPFEDFKDELTKRALREAVVREEVSRKITFKRAEIEAYYKDHLNEFQRNERIFLREILIATKGKDAAGVAAAQKKAKELVDRARHGEHFPEMAQANSDDEATAAQGGELPPYEKGVLIPELESAVWEKERGYITDPIKTDAGFIILRVEEHQQAGLASLDQVEEEVTDKLFQPRMAPAVRAYLTKLREQAFLQIKPGFEDTGAAPGKDTTWQDPLSLKPATVTKQEVAAKKVHKKLLGIPIPGTTTQATGTSTSH